MMLRSFFRRRPSATWLAHAVDRAALERRSQFHAAPTNGLLIDARDFEQDAVRPMPDPLGFHRQIPAPLLLVQATQQQIHLPVVLMARVSFTPPTRTAPALVDRLSWHASSPSPSASCAHSTSPGSLEVPMPEVVLLQPLSDLAPKADMGSTTVNTPPVRNAASHRPTCSICSEANRPADDERVGAAGSGPG